MLSTRHAAAGMVVASLLALGCGPAQPPQNGSSMNNGPPTGPHSNAPVVVTLAQGAANAQTGETDIIATIDVNEPISYPVSLAATAPRAGQLTSGQAQEAMTLDHPGRLTRTYRVKGPLSVDDPFHILVRGSAPNGSAGFSADRQFPPRPELIVPDSNGPRPPGGRPPGAHP